MKKKYKILIAGGLIFTALGLIALSAAEAFGIIPGIETSMGKISIPAVLITVFVIAPYIGYKICLGEYHGTLIPLALIFMMFEKNIAALCGRDDGDLINNWLLLGCAVLASIGLKIIIPKKKFQIGKVHFFKPGFKINSKNKAFNDKTTVVHYDAADFTEEYTGNGIPSLVIRFDNTEDFTGGTLHLGHTIGAAVVEVPKTWRFVCDTAENKPGAFQAPKCHASDAAPLLTINCGPKIGALLIRTV